MSEKPILFSANMVRAILDGRKTQTRRVMRSQPPFGRYRVDTIIKKDMAIATFTMQYDMLCSTPAVYFTKCPYGASGDSLWVRETWDFVFWDQRASETDVIVLYGADGNQSRPITIPNGWNPMLYNYQRWRPSIHMPRWASRLTLRITDIGVERVQDITEDDAIAEGAPLGRVIGYGRIGMQSHKEGFIDLWDSINAKRGYPWSANPWVWVVNFDLCEA